MEYRIKTTGGWRAIDGEAVVIPGFEEFEFFVHETFDIFKQPYCVTEASTGRAIADRPSAKKAIKAAQTTLTLVGEPAFRDDVDLYLKEEG